MIIHSPIISGSLTFADGGALALPNPTQLSGSFSGSAQFSEITSHIVPDAANTYDLGSATNYFRDLYISTGSLKGIGNGTVAFKLSGKTGGGLKVTDDNDDEVEIVAKEITLKDTSGNGNNIKLKVQNGALKSTKVDNTDTEDDAEEVQTLQSNISGSLIVTGSTSLENTTIAGTVDATGLASLDGGINVADNLTVDASGNTVVGGTLDSTGLASLDGGVDVDGAFTVANTTGNVSTSGTLGVTGTSTLGVINASGLLSANGGIDVDGGAFTVADSTGNVSTTGTLSAGNTDVVTLDASGLASLDGGIDVGGAFTVADTSGNVSTSGTLAAGNTTITGTTDVTGLASLDGGIDVDGAFTVANTSGNVSTTGTLSAGNTTVGTLGSSGLASLDGGIDVDGAFTVANTSGNVSTTGTLGAGNTTISGTVDASGLASLDGGVDVDGAFTVADGTGNVVTSGTLNVTGLTTVGVISGSAMDITGDLGVGGDLTVAGAMTTDGHIIPSLHNTYDLGSTTKFWRDLYLSSGSLYINGIQVLSTDGTDLTFQTDEGESTKILETANDTITLESVNGDITLTATGTGNIELDAPIQINAGKNILSSDGNAINFGDDVSLGVNSIYAANLSGVVSSSAITYDGDDISVAGNAVITGDLTVSGTTTSVNSNTVNIGDNQIVLNSDETGTPTQNGGIAIERGTSTNASIIWNETNDYWMSGLLGAEERIVVGAGNTSITTLGTITTGVWNGTAITHNYIGLDAIDGTNISDNSINSEHYVDGSIDNAHLAADSVTGAKIADNAIDSEHYTDGSIDSDHLAADCINSTKIADGNVNNEHIGANAVDGSKIADNAIDSEHYTDGSIDGVHLAASAVTYAKIQNVSATNRILGRDSSGAGVIEEITPANLRTMINVEDGATADQTAAEIRTAVGTGNNGVIPSAGSAGQFLKHDGTFGTPSYTTNTDTNTQNTTTLSFVDSSNDIILRNTTGGAGSGTQDIKLVAGSNITLAHTDANNFTISSTDTNTTYTRSSFIDQDVNTDSAVTFASVSATGDIVAYASSDERLKDNIEVISNPIEKVQQLKGVTWDWNDKADELQQSLPNVGVIAQDVEKVLPQLVKDRDNGFKGVDYAKIVGLLIEAIKDQQTQIDELKSKLS
jgi:hypothetical protein